jgi:hypothetical protein
MKMSRWNPVDAYTKQESLLMSRVHRHRKLFGFLREHRC